MFMEIQMGQRRNQKANFKNLEANENRNIITGYSKSNSINKRKIYSYKCLYLKE